MYLKEMKYLTVFPLTKYFEVVIPLFITHSALVKAKHRNDHKPFFLLHQKGKCV